MDSVERSRPALVSTPEGLRHRDSQGNLGPVPHDPKRDELLAEWRRFDAMSVPQRQLYRALRAVCSKQSNPSRVPRTLDGARSSRPRSRARRAARRGATRAGPGDDDGEAEPGSPGSPPDFDLAVGAAS